MTKIDQTHDGTAEPPQTEVAISDTHLVEEARAGDHDAYLRLWVRHVEAVRRVAATVPVDGSVERFVNRAFARVLKQIRIDRDPLGPFRAYLLTVLHAEFGVPDDAALPATNVLRAFRRLPVRAQTVLWYSVVEQCAPRETAVFVGEEESAIVPLRDTSVDQLRAEWLVELVCDPSLTDTCAWLVQRAGARARGELRQVAADRFDRHLAGCATCQEFLRTLEAFPEVLRHDYQPLFTVEPPAEDDGDL